MSAPTASTQGTLAASGNYALNYTSADLTVGQRAITVTADAKSRAYGDANPALTYQVGGSGLANGDTPVGCAGDLGDDVASNVGTYGINAGHAGGLGQLRAELYERRPDRRPARPITVAADAQSRVYGNANPGLTYQVTGGTALVNGDELQRSADDGGNGGIRGRQLRHQPRTR